MLFRSLDLLKFFLYHKQTTHVKIAKALRLENNLASLKGSHSFRDEREIETGFVGKDFDLEKEQIHSKVLWPQRKEGENNFFKERNKRIIYAFTQIGQVLIYTSYKVTRYREIAHEKREAMERTLINTHKSIVLTKILGKLAINISMEESKSKDLSVNMEKAIINSAACTLGQENSSHYHSEVDFFYCTYYMEDSPRKKRQALFYNSSPDRKSVV